MTEAAPDEPPEAEFEWHGNLKFKVDPAAMLELQGIVQKMQMGRSVLEVLQERECVRRLSPCESSKYKSVIYTDFEPDDAMAVAQLLSWKRELRELGPEPMVIMAVDFRKKDFGTVLEKKQLMAALMDGLPELRMLTHEGDSGPGVAAPPHPRSQEVADKRVSTLESIAEELARFEGERIDLYVLAPGRGNLAAILAGLKAKGAWPLKAKWRVSMYTGSFNTRGTHPQDVDALAELVQAGDSPLVDLSKFCFFGKQHCHACTDSLATFALPVFAQEISEQDPLLAALLTAFNTEFNATLINPLDKDPKLFKQPLDEGEKGRFDAVRRLFTPADPKAYAKALRADEGLWKKLCDHKRSNVLAFATGSCDAPLCDQLVFLYEWLVRYRPETVTNGPEGKWILAERTGFTCVDPVQPGGIRAIQPLLASPKDEASMNEMRHVTQRYIFEHMSSLQGGCFKMPTSCKT